MNLEEFRIKLFGMSGLATVEKAFDLYSELEAENERMKGENEKLEKKLKKAENAFCVAHHCINRTTIGCRKNCRKMEEFLFMIEEED